MATRPYSAGTFSPQQNTFIIGGLVLLTGLTMAVVLAAGDLGIGGLVAFVPVLIGLLALIVSNPYYGLMFYVNYSFFFIGLNRYLVGLPLGLSIDVVLFITTLSMLFRLNKDNIKKLSNGTFLTTGIWFFYTVLEALNPQAPRLAAWIYAVRGVSFYAIQTIPLTLLLLDNKEKLYNFIKIVMVWGVISSLWGLKQINIGVDAYEQGWLNREGKITHILDGKLRAFSFFSDAGQFGVTMAYVASIFLILALGRVKNTTRFWYLTGFVICILGMGVSGSRGPVFVIFTSLLAYLLLIRNFRVLIPGLGMVLIIFFFLKFTYIGNTNYQIYRARTAIDPQDASLLVRLDNQAKLRKYLEDKPFGAGIGTTDVWAFRFYPGSFLTTLPTDSWFVKIWAENGVVGLSFYALSLAFVLVMGVVNIRRVKDKELRQILIAMYGGYLGILIASYGNPVFGQAPLGALMYISMAVLCSAGTWETEPQPALKQY